MRIIVKVLCFCFVIACSCMHNDSKVKLGVCFTGQGVGIVGVANDFIEHVTTVSERYKKIKELTNITDDDVLSGENASLFQQGKAQVALVSVQCLIFEGIRSLYPDLHFDCIVGQSLGNYTALFASGAITLENLLKFIQLRDRLSKDLSQKSRQLYGMLVVQGTDLNTIQKYIDNKALFIAGMNTMSCFTVSGLHNEIEALAGTLQKDIQDIKLSKLNIAAPFHTKFMEPIVDELWENFLIESELTTLIISDATGNVHNSSESFDKNWMMKQLTGPMRWSGNDGVCKKIRERGLTHLIVVGDGEGLAKMLKENIPDINVYVVNNIKQLHEIVGCIKEAN